MDQNTLEGCKICATQNGIPAGVWDHAQFESDRISDLTGWRFWAIKETQDYLLSRFKRTAREPNIGLNPRSGMEFSFSAENDVRFFDPVANGDGEGQVSRSGLLRDVEGDLSSVNFLGLKRGALMCDPPRSRMQMGIRHYRESRGAHVWETDCVCMWDLWGTAPGTVPAYFRGIRESFPMEVQVALQREFLRWIIAQGRHNSVEPNAPAASAVANELTLSEGNIAYIPKNVIHWSTLDQHSSVMYGNNWSGAVEYFGCASSLYWLKLSYQKGVVQSSLEANSWDAFNVPAGESMNFTNFGYKVSRIPWLGYIDDDSNIRLLTPRKLVAGNAGGMIQEYDPKYVISPWYEKNGKKYQKVELIQFMQQDAAEVMSFQLPKMDWSGVDTTVPTAFDVGVELIGGPYIQGNEFNKKFFVLAQSQFIRRPRRPECMGVIASLFRPIATHVPLDLPDWADCLNVETPIEIGQAPATRANRHVDAENSLDATLPPPVEPSAGDACPTNVAGNIIVPCAAMIASVPGVVKIVVERANGSLGAASVRVSTSNGTALSGTHYIGITPTTVSWADGEFGKKEVEVLVTGDPAQTGDVSFTVSFDQVTGGSLPAGSCTSTTVVIPKPCTGEAVCIFEVSDDGDSTDLSDNGYDGEYFYSGYDTPDGEKVYTNGLRYWLDDANGNAGFYAATDGNVVYEATSGSPATNVDLTQSAGTITDPANDDNPVGTSALCS